MLHRVSWASRFLNGHAYGLRPGAFGRPRTITTVHSTDGSPDKGRKPRRPSSGAPRGESADSSRSEQVRAKPSGCRNLPVRMLLLPYALASLREADAITFEAHLLACPACLRDLKSLDRARAVIDEFRTATGRGLEALLDPIPPGPKAGLTGPSEFLRKGDDLLEPRPR